jgi:ribosome-associated heat shock protein Hsp15
MENRIDKYLWSVRVFKTRTLATEACKSKKVLIDNNPVKASRIVKNGDIIEIKQMPIVRTYKVIDTPKSRVSAKIVKDFVIETTPEEEFIKLKLAKTNQIKRDKGTGRPTKKDRRLLDKLKD